MTKSDQAVTKKCKPYKVDKQYINPMRLTFRAGNIFIWCQVGLLDNPT